MKKIAFLLVMIFLSSSAFAQESSVIDTDKQHLIEHIQDWVAVREDVESQHVEVAALDRRLKVPNCNNQLVIEYPYSTSKNTVQVTCPELSWKVFVSIKINQPKSVLIYTRDINANQLLALDDVNITAIQTSERGYLLTLN